MGEGRFTARERAVSRRKQDGQNGRATMDGGHAAARRATFIGRPSRCLTMCGVRDYLPPKAIALVGRGQAASSPLLAGEAREAVTAMTSKKAGVRGLMVSQRRRPKGSRAVAPRFSDAQVGLRTVWSNRAIIGVKGRGQDEVRRTEVRVSGVIESQGVPIIARCRVDGDGQQGRNRSGR